MPSSGAIDVPIEALPHIDEHSVVIDAGPDEVWAAMVATLPKAMGGRRGARMARVLGCEQSEPRGDIGVIGSTVPGFVVSRSVRPACLALLGAHRFSRYALVFTIDRINASRSRLHAETRAEFPGGKGRVYRALVIGTRAHVLVVKRMLSAVKRRAERGG